MSGEGERDVMMGMEDARGGCCTIRRRLGMDSKWKTAEPALRI